MHHVTKYCNVIVLYSVVASFPCLPHFCLLFAFTIIHVSGEPVKMWRPRSIDHMSGHKVDVQGEEPMFKYVHIITWKQVSCWSRQVVSIMLRSGVHNCGRLLEQMIKCIVLVVGPLHPPYVHLTLVTWWMLPGLPCFSLVLRGRSCVLLWTQTEGKMGEAWYQGYNAAGYSLYMQFTRPFPSLAEVGLVCETRSQPYQKPYSTLPLTVGIYKY